MAGGSLWICEKGCRLLTAFTPGYRFRSSMGWSSMSRTLGIIGVLGFFIAAFTPFVNVLARWQATPGQLEPAEAIVVLGADSAGGGGALGTTSLRRGVHGIGVHPPGGAPPP